MDYNKPTDVVASMIEAGRTKLGLSTRDLLVRGILAGAILATATTLAFEGEAQRLTAAVSRFKLPGGADRGGRDIPVVAAPPRRVERPRRQRVPQRIS